MNKYPIGPSVKIKFDFKLEYDLEGELENYKLSLRFP